MIWKTLVSLSVSCLWPFLLTWGRAVSGGCTVSDFVPATCLATEKPRRQKSCLCACVWGPGRGGLCALLLPALWDTPRETAIFPEGLGAGGGVLVRLLQMLDPRELVGPGVLSYLLPPPQPPMTSVDLLWNPL